MSNNLQKTTDQSLLSAEEYSKHQMIVETVRQTVFPQSSDAELMLFFHKCQTVGVHPLSGMIHPMKFNSNEGSKVTFITSIDVLRSRSMETGQYDGMDEPEFEDTIPFDTASGTIEVPEMCTVRVYRKDISRPFTGTARWKEFYPGERKGHQWRQKPFLMLAKCAEAQARRQAFPEELNKLYTAEEMEATTTMLAGMQGAGASSKPTVNPNDVTESTGDTPTEAQRKSGKLISEKQAALLFRRCKENNVNPEAIAKCAKVKNIHWLTWDKNNSYSFERILKTVQEKPDFFNQYDQKQEEAKPEPLSENHSSPNVMDAEEFEKEVKALAKSASITDKGIDMNLKAQFKINSLSEVPAEMQSKVIDYFTALSEEQAGA
ncbi:MAG: phage recombination protein Bet [Chitinispirillaceae bacterium]